MIKGEVSWGKKEWRIAARRSRDQVDLNQDAYARTSSIFLDEILKPYKKNPIVAAYWPIGNEFDTRGLLQILHSQEIPTALPRVAIDGDGLYFHRWSWGDPLENSKFSLSEPFNDMSTLCTPDIAVMPLLAFDGHGTRLGYGAGHYDRTLVGKDKIFKVGIAFSEQQTDIALPSQSHDVKMDAVLTPEGLIRFN